MYLGSRLNNGTHYLCLLTSERRPGKKYPSVKVIHNFGKLSQVAPVTRGRGLKTRSSKSSSRQMSVMTYSMAMSMQLSKKLSQENGLPLRLKYSQNHLVILINYLCFIMDIFFSDLFGRTCFT